MKLIKKIKLLPNAIRGFERGNPYRNGEYKFIRSYLKSNMTIIDAGANTGYYAQYILSMNPAVRIHCFEPVKKTYNLLTKNLEAEIKSGEVLTNNVALSNEDKTAEMFIYDELDERNSLHLNKEHKFNSDTIHKESVRLTTLDLYAMEYNISKIDLLKIDVEGHETKVIEGASDLIEKKLIKCIQFEYNNNWEAAGFKLEDTFNKLSKYGYKFYRLAVWGKIRVRHFKKELENYRHSNYIAVLKNST